MIIVSQDKTEIVNFNNIESVWTCPDEEGRFTIEATADTNSTLGIYKTEERAKEVLQEIIKQKAMFELFRTVPTGGREQTEMLERFAQKKIILDTYEMPEE